MKYCSKCGNQISEDAAVCMHCGCAVEGKSYINRTSPQTSPLNTPKITGVIVKQNLGRLWLASMLGGLVFGAMMMIGFGPIGILSGLLFGVLFGFAMQIVTGTMEKKWAPKRAEISAKTTILVEGGANLDGNGGWLFVTEEGVEYYTHKMNFDHRTLNFSRDDIQSIHKEGSKLAVIANNVKYVFVVNYVDRWINIVQAYKA